MFLAGQKKSHELRCCPTFRSRFFKIASQSLGERCEFYRRGLGQGASRNQIRCIVALQCDIWWP